MLRFPGRCGLALLVGLLAAGCASPKPYVFKDGGSDGGEGTSDDAAGFVDMRGLPLDGASGAGSDAPADAPSSADTGGQPIIAACSAGMTRCRQGAPIVEVCTVAGAWVMKETCTAVCAAEPAAACARRTTSTAGPTRHPRPATPRASGSPASNVRTSAAVRGLRRHCKPGTKRCAGPDNLTPRHVTRRAWVDGTACPNLCSSGSCGGSCAPNTKRAARTDARNPAARKAPGNRPSSALSSVRAEAAQANASRAARTAWPRPADLRHGPLATAPACTNLCMNGGCTGDCMPGRSSLWSAIRRSSLQRRRSLGGIEDVSERVYRQRCLRGRLLAQLEALQPKQCHGSDV